MSDKFLRFLDWAPDACGVAVAVGMAGAVAFIQIGKASGIGALTLTGGLLFVVGLIGFVAFLPLWIMARRKGLR